MTITNRGSMYIKVPCGCLHFNGTNDDVYASSNQLRYAKTIAATAWIKTHDWSNNTCVLSRNYGIMINGPYSNNIEFYAHDGVDATSYSQSWDLDDKWHHVSVMARPYTAGDIWTIKGYIDGEFVGSGLNTSFGGCGNTGNYFWLGDRGTTTAQADRAFSGQICDVRFYSGQILTDDQFRQIYNGIDITDGLICHWKFDDREGATLADSREVADGTVDATWHYRDIRCWNTRWDESNWDVTVETFMDPCDRNYLYSNVTPGAVRELYNVLGTPKYKDTTFTSSNSLIIDPLSGVGLSSLRYARTIAIKNVSDSFLTKDYFSCKIEGKRLDIE